MTTVFLAATNVVGSPSVGGHLWVYLQYVLGLRELGCNVYWLEKLQPSGDQAQDAALLRAFHERMARHGLAGKCVLYTAEPSSTGGETTFSFGERSNAEAEALLRRADLLLNFYYGIDPALLARFARTALVDIDPGLLQFWMSTGQIHVPAHDLYFTIGETVGRPGARFPDCGRAWTRFRPPIALSAWPRIAAEPGDAFTTVSSWWGGGGKGEWITDGADLVYENNKRVTFLEFVELPRRVPQALELALYLGDGDATLPPTAAEVSGWKPRKPAARGATDYVGDAHDVALLREHGWRVQHSRDVAGTPEQYQAYVQSSRGEFSCAKPSCMAFQNAWISDRTLCYLASGRPAVVQDTGPSEFLPNGRGLFRFSTLDEAAAALAAVDADYPAHSSAAREIAETYFDARSVLPGLLRAAGL